MSRINTLWNLAVAIALVATGSGFAAHHGASVSIEDFQRAKVAIGKGVESGDITKEQAKARLLEIRRMIGGERKAEEHQSAGSRGLSIEDFQRAKVGIGKRVESGHITEEQAATRLREMRRMIEGERKAEEHQPSETGGLSIEDFQRAKVAIGKRVESGHITKEHAKTRLREMRRMIDW